MPALCVVLQRRGLVELAVLAKAVSTSRANGIQSATSDTTSLRVYAVGPKV